MRLEFDVMVGWYNVEFMHCSRVSAPSANPDAPILLLWIAENHQALLEVEPYLLEVIIRIILGIEQLTPADLLRVSERNAPVSYIEHEQLRKQIPISVPVKVPHPRNLIAEPCKDVEAEVQWFGYGAYRGLIDAQHSLGMDVPQKEMFRALIRNLADIVPQLTNVAFRTRRAFTYLLEDARYFPATALESAALLGVRLKPTARRRAGKVA